ncbi:MAG: HYR domain-containing protein [Saprospirales bacterium]|nr:MAG: HYR domain-containing protein [Saprospirales bacterium]
MKQIITLVGFLCFAFSSFVYAQDPTFALSDEQMSCEDDEILTVEVAVEHFDSISGMQGSIVFDPDELEVDELRDFFPGGLFTPNINNADGWVTFSWFVPVGLNFDDGDVVMELDFIVHNPSVVAVHDIEFSGSPTAIEVIQEINGSPQGVPNVPIDGSIAIFDDVDPEITCPDDVNLTVDAGETGDTVENIDPDASDNCGIDEVTYALSGATGGSGDNDASGTFFNLGTTVVEYTVVDFDGNSASCSFEITITEDDPDPATVVELNVVDSDIDCNNSGSVNIAADGIDDIGLLTFTIEFDANEFTFDGYTEFLGDNVTVDDSDAANGSLGFSFSSTDGYNEADGFVIATIDFSASSNVGNYAISFTGSVNAIEAEDTDGEDVDVVTNDGNLEIVDEIDPFVDCPDNVVVDADQGATSAQVDDIEPADSGDNCGVDYLDYTISGASSGTGSNDASGTEFNVGVSTVTYTIADFAGNTAECSFTVTVNQAVPVSDTVHLVLTSGAADCGNTVTLDVEVYNFNDVLGTQFSINFDDENFSFVSGSLNFPGGTSNFNDGDDFITVSWVSGTEESLPNGTVVFSFTLEVFGEEGISDVVFSNTPNAIEVSDLDGPMPVTSQNGTVDITDNEDPVVECPDDVTVTVPFASGSADVDDIEPTELSDDCGIASVDYTLSGATSGSGSDDASGESFNVGVTTVSYLATDVNDNTAECSFQVTVEEAAPGDDLVAYIENYEFDCNLDQVVVSVRVQNFDDVSGVQYSVNWDENSLEYVDAEVTLPAGTSDINDNFVNDGKLATSWVNGSEISLANGTAILEITFNILSASGVTSDVEITDDPVAIEFSNLNGPVPHDVIDGSVTYEDNEAPTVVCPDDLTVFVDVLGDPSVAINDIDADADDNCEVVSVEYAITGDTDVSGSGDASGTEFNLGTSVVTYTVEDGAGNSAECSFSALVLPLLTEEVTVNVGSATPSCGEEFTIDLTVEDFIGLGGVQFTVSWDEEVIDYVDIEAFFPSNNGSFEINDSLTNDGLLLVSWVGDEDVTLDNGDVIITLTFLAVGDLGDETVVDIINDPLDIEFSSIDPLTNQIDYVINAGDVEIIDEVDPIAVCQDITVDLDANGEATIVADDVDGGSSDNCGEISLEIDNDSFGCDHTGDNTVTLTVTDPSGNVATCEATVTVEDNSAPILDCVDSTQVFLDADGEAVLDLDQVIVEVSDNCEVVDTFANVSEYDCSLVGSHDLTITAVDPSGNETTCDFHLEVIDNIPPVLECVDSLQIALDVTGLAALDLDDVVTEVSDACGIEQLFANVDQYDCSLVGEHDLFVTAIDSNGNESTCDFHLTVVDDMAPELSCVDSLEIFLDEDGFAALDLDDVIISVTDNCEVVDTFANVSEYDCSLVGSHDLTITAVDPSGNETTCDFHLEVIDNIPPVLECVDSLQIALDVTGLAALDLDDVVTEVSDACGIEQLFANVDQYDCSLVGEHDLFVTAIDSNGNESTCDFHLTVIDDIAPELTCIDSLTIGLDSTGFAALDLDDVVIEASDACGIEELFANVDQYDCDLVGEHDLFVTAIDSNGNESTCDFHLTVIDDIAPVLECVAEIDVFLDENGEASVDPDDIILSVEDNCDIDEVTAEPIEFGCGDVGAVTIEVEATDVNGNVSSCQVTANVQDNIPPTVLCQDIVAELDEDGEVVVTAEDVDDGSFDNCGIASVEPQFVVLTCDDIGENTFVGTVTDVNGNTATCEVTITVEDNMAPTALCVDGFDVELMPSNNFEFALDVDDIDAGSFDNCGDISLEISQTLIIPQDVGDLDIILTVTDDSGNSSTCVTTLNVVELPPCVLICPDNVVVDTDPGICEAFVGGLEVETTGFCEESGDITNSFNGGEDASGVYPLGSTTVTFSIDDPDVADCVFTVVVEDNEPPVFNCPNEVSVTLGGGECGVNLDFIPDVSDNCLAAATPGAGFMDDITTTFAGGNGFAGNMFDITNVSTETIRLDSFLIHIGNAPGTAADIDFYATPGTYVGNETDPSVWTLFASETVPYNGTNVPTLFPFGGLIIEPGESFGIYMDVANYAGGGPRAIYTDGNVVENDGNIEIEAGIGRAAGAFTGTVFASRIWNGTVFYSVGAGVCDEIDLVQTAGPVSGTFIEIGTHFVEFEATDCEGNVSTCGFEVIVNEFPNPVTSLACNDMVNVSVDENCIADINADMILEGGPYRCYDDYELIFETSDGDIVEAPFGAEVLDSVLTVTVVDPVTGNSCWGNLLIEDKIDPVIECRDLNLLCGDIFPEAPAPAFDGEEFSIALTGLNDEFGNVASGAPAIDLEYEFDFSALGADFTVSNVRLRVDGEILRPHDNSIFLESPDGTEETIYNATTFNAGTFPLDITFDDEGEVVTTYDQFNTLSDGTPVQPINGTIAAGAGPVFFNFAGENAQGVWTVRFETTFISAFTAAGGTISEVELILNIDAPEILPFDNCGDIDLTFADDLEIFTDCDSELERIINRTWTVEDQSGNTSSCEQTINIRRITLDELEAPENYDGITNPGLPCGGNWATDDNGNPHPSVTGGFESVCDNIYFTYEDLTFDVGDCGLEKLLRTWYVLDDCTNETTQFTQLILIDNSAPPVVECPANVQVSTSFNSCEGSWDATLETLFAQGQIDELPSDICSDNVTYTVTASAGNVEEINGNWIVSDLPFGDHTVTYVVDDGCGNTAECVTGVSVIDDVAPVAICDLDTRVSLGGGTQGFARVFVDAFDDGSWDNCGVESILVRRSRDDNNFAKNSQCDNSRTEWQEFMDFCCEDIEARDGEVDIYVQVTDLSGNTNICSVTVFVEDNVAPSITCPSDLNVTVNCLFDFGDFDFNDPNSDLSQASLDELFGGIVAIQRGEERVTRVVDPAALPADALPEVTIIDGIAIDNCPNGMEIDQEIFIGVIEECGNLGTGVQVTPTQERIVFGQTTPQQRQGFEMDDDLAIVRGWRATDAFGNVTLDCVQQIKVVNTSPFSGIDQFSGLPPSQWEIVWPGNVTLSECFEGNGVDPDQVGEPQIQGPNLGCADILTSYTDAIFTGPQAGNACMKILRTWQVIDWCQPATIQSPWTHVQEIKIMNADAPIVVNCEDLVFEVTDNTCEKDIELIIELDHACIDEDVLEDALTISWQIDAFNNGTFDFSGTGDNASSVYPVGEHRIVWTVTDPCGNTTVCEQIFEIVDAKPPTPVCFHGIATVIMPSSGCITLSAETYDAGSFDNCTDSTDLIFSFSEDIDSTTITFCCDALGSNRIELWVTDEAGNQDFCETFILIQDPNEICNDISIAGTLQTEDMEAIEDGTVELTRNDDPFSSIVTGNDGGFTFNAGIALNNDYVLTPFKDINPLNGVTTFDIALIQRHILGIQYLDSPYKLIAADVRPDGVINVLDIADLRSLILGRVNEFPNNTSWRFVSSDQIFDQGMVQPPNPAEIETVRSYEDLQATVRNADFFGVKIGDVDNSNQPNSLIGAQSRSIANPVNIIVDRFDFEAGEFVEVDFRASEFNQVLGYQFTLNFNQNMIDFDGFKEGSLNDLSEANFGFHLLDDGMITTSWNASEHVTRSEDDVLFTLQFVAKADGSTDQLFSITSAVTASEAYRSGDGPVIVNLQVEDVTGTVDSDVFALYQNTPNPFGQSTVIGFVLPEEVSGSITIYDVTGKVVKVIQDEFVRGYNEVQLDRNDLPASGVYYYQLEAGSNNATKKMMLIE